MNLARSTPLALVLLALSGCGAVPEGASPSYLEVWRVGLSLLWIVAAIAGALLGIFVAISVVIFVIDVIRKLSRWAQQ